MGWRQYARSVEAAGRRSERAALKRHRELLKQHHAQQRLAERERGANEVALFDSYLDVLVSVHKEGGDVWDWKAIGVAPAPPEPTRATGRETAARHALYSFEPTFFQRLFGGEKKVRAVLDAAVELARAEDTREYGQIVARHQKACVIWKWRRELAAAVIHRDLEAYKTALKHAGVGDELAAFKTRVAFDVVEAEVVALSCLFEDDELVPKEELKLTAGGKVSTKEMAAGKYWALYQDHVCSCALRLASETFGVLPVSRVLVNVRATRLDTSTGHPAAVTLLGAKSQQSLNT
jgi:hypothetical protein